MRVSIRSAPRTSPGPGIRHARWHTAGALAWLVGASAPALAIDVQFLPQVAGQFADGQGADATFLQIDGAWHGSQVLWDEAAKVYGTGVPVGSQSWGTGIWGQVDWQAVQQAASAPGTDGAPAITRRWTGLASTVNFGNALYNTQYAGTWGTATLAPIFQADGSTPDQDNWTASLTGYIRVTEAGRYNFSVLNDDGFFFQLTGAAGARQSIGRDFLNARDRTGFSDNLLLSPGLYGFDLGMWNREEAGVVDLRWMTPDTTTWALVPTSNLLSTSAVPEPASGLLGLAGLAALWAWRRRQAVAGVRRA